MRKVSVTPYAVCSDVSIIKSRENSRLFLSLAIYR
jgi:hypothetical protein